jgi:hypothetical protein
MNAIANPYSSSGYPSVPVVSGTPVSGEVLTATSATSATWELSGASNNNNAPVLITSFSNGTASQLSDTTRDYMIYLQIGTAGTAFSLLIGPTATPANTLMSSAAPTADELLTFRLPAGWYVQWTGTLTTITTQTAIGC